MDRVWAMGTLGCLADLRATAPEPGDRVRHSRRWVGLGPLGLDPSLALAADWKLGRFVANLRVIKPFQSLRRVNRHLPEAVLPPDADQPLPARRPQPSDIGPESRVLVDGAVDALGLPAVSVIVPTRNRGEWLAYVFQALARQVYPAGLVEVLVVDNASVDHTQEIVRRWAEVLPFPVRFLRKANEGPAASRNYAAARATGDVLAFTDSDCMPEPYWLLNGVGALKDGVGLVTGPIIPRRTSDTHFFFNAQLGAVLHDTGLYRTASLFVPRAVFVAVGGFDEAFALGRGGVLLGGEDTDLGWRIKRSGQHSVFRPDVVVVHLATPISFRGWLMRPLLSQIIPRLLRTIPELRKTMLWHGYFHSDGDFFFLVGVGALASALVLNLWPLALLPLGFVWSTRSSLAGMVKKGRLDKAAAILALLLARRALNVAVLSYASVRYRRLVL